MPWILAAISLLSLCIPQGATALEILFETGVPCSPLDCSGTVGGLAILRNADGSFQYLAQSFTLAEDAHVGAIETFGSATGLATTDQLTVQLTPSLGPATLPADVLASFVVDFTPSLEWRSAPVDVFLPAGPYFLTYSVPEGQGPLVPEEDLGLADRSLAAIGPPADAPEFPPGNPFAESPTKSIGLRVLGTVPEPRTEALVALGLVALAPSIKRKRRCRAPKT